MRRFTMDRAQLPWAEVKATDADLKTLGLQMSFELF